MPYKDPEKRREVSRRSYAKRAKSAEFKRKEAERKARWLEGNEERKAKMREYSRWWRRFRELD